MSEVATDDCEGCDEERPVQQLEEVRLPSGQTVVCCPDCRYHAEKLREGATRPCDGCGTEVAVDDLEPTPLTDGRKLDLCDDCVAEASTIYEAERASGASSATSRGESGGTATASADVGGSAASGAGGATDATSTDGTASASADDAGATSTAGDASTQTESGSDESDAGSASDESEDASSPSDDAGRTGKPATTDNVCDQCGELFSIELYKVKTVDGRTEEFCPDCKEEGVHEGIVRDVELRRAQAYEVLELDGSASQDEVRQAYLRRVKEVHPDRADGNRSEFMLVQQAYERLDEE